MSWNPMWCGPRAGSAWIDYCSGHPVAVLLGLEAVTCTADEMTFTLGPTPMPNPNGGVHGGLLSAAPDHALLARLTDLVLEHEGVDPANPVARSGTWLYLHRPAAMLVGGTPVQAPHYRIVATVPEGQFDDDRRARLVASVTAAVLE